MIGKATNVELEVTRLRILEAMCDDTMNLRTYGEHEDRDEGPLDTGNDTRE